MDEKKRVQTDGKKKEELKNEKVEKVVKGPVKVKQESKFAKFAKTFIVEDVRSVLSWAAMDVAVPALKKLFVEFVDSTVNSMVYGKDNYSNKRTYTNGNTSYRDYYDKPRGKDSGGYYSRNDDVYSYGTIEVGSRQDAENVLYLMDEIINRYGFVTVGQLMEMVGLRPRSTDYNYGWTSVRTAQIARMVNGYYQIRLPKVMQID